MALDPTLPAFPFAPEWTETLLERLEFRTDAIPAMDGSEQTRATRLTPRRTFEFTVAEQATARQWLANLVWGKGPAPMYLPVWVESRALGAPLGAADLVLPIDTTDLLDVTVGSVVALRGAMPSAAAPLELAEVGAIAAGSITLVRPAPLDWPAGSLLLPVRRARLDPDFTTQAFNRSLTLGRARFLVNEANPYPEADTGVDYRGFPVLTTRPFHARDPDHALDRSTLELVDDGIGLVTAHDPVGIPLYRQVHDWALDTRAQVQAFRSLVYALKGKRGSLWVPTWLDDLTPAAPLASGGTGLVVDWCGYAAHIAQAVNRRDLRIELEDGAVHYRRIIDSQDLGDGTELLTLDAALGVATTPDSVAQVSFMGLCRSDADAFEFSWWTGEYAEVKTAWRARQHDV